MRYTKPSITNTYAAVSAIQSDKNAIQNEGSTLVPSPGPSYTSEE